MTPHHDIPNQHRLEELQALSPTLAAWPVKQVWRMPEGYFRELPGKVIQQTTAAPQGYFDTLPDTVMQRIRHIESGAGDPSLSFPANRNPYRMPTGYFDTVASRVPIDTSLPGKVVPLWKRVRNFAAVAAAAAAILLAVIWLSTPTSSSPVMAEAIATEDLIGYLEDHLTLQEEVWLLDDVASDITPALLDSSQHPVVEEILIQELTIEDLEEALL